MKKFLIFTTFLLAGISFYQFCQRQNAEDLNVILIKQLENADRIYDAKIKSARIEERQNAEEEKDDLRDHYEQKIERQGKNFDSQLKDTLRMVNAKWSSRLDSVANLTDVKSYRMGEEMEYNRWVKKFTNVRKPKLPSDLVSDNSKVDKSGKVVRTYNFESTGPPITGFQFKEFIRHFPNGIPILILLLVFIVLPVIWNIKYPRQVRWFRS